MCTILSREQQATVIQMIRTIEIAVGIVPLSSRQREFMLIVARSLSMFTLLHALSSLDTSVLYGFTPIDPVYQ